MSNLKKMYGCLLTISIFTALSLAFTAFPTVEFLAGGCEWIRRNTLIGALLFIPVEAIWVCVCFPTTPLELAAGYAFGVGFGFVVDTLGKLLGCCIAFSLGRYCFRSFAKKSCFSRQGSELLRAVDSSFLPQRPIGKKDYSKSDAREEPTSSTHSPSQSPPSWDSLQLLMLIQLAYIPIAVKNYGLALTAVPFSPFFFTSLIGEMPSTAAIVYTGASTADLMGLLDGGGHMTGTQLCLSILGILALFVLMTLLGRRVHQRLREFSSHPQKPQATTTTTAAGSLRHTSSIGEIKPLLPRDESVVCP